MDFTLDAEQEALRDAVRGLLGKAYESSETRREVVNEDPGFSEKTWSQLAEMGALGLPVRRGRRRHGRRTGRGLDRGRGDGPRHRARAVRRGGRAGRWPRRRGRHRRAARRRARPRRRGPARAGRRARRAGSTVGPDRRRRHGVSSRATRWTLSGVKEPVLHGARADALVVSAATDAGTGLFLVEGDAAGLTRTGYRTFEGGRAAHVAFDGTPAHAARRRDVRPVVARRRRRRPRPGGVLPRGARRDGHRVEAHRRVPQDPQAVRRHPEHVPGAHLPRRRPVRLAGAGPQHRDVGDARARSTSRAAPARPPPARSCRSPRPDVTSARRPSSCTAASA